MSEPKLHVLCARPGLIRGGVSHPSVAAHAMDAFTRAQLEQMLAEPAIAVVVGHLVLPEHLDDLLGVPEAVPSDPAIEADIAAVEAAAKTQRRAR